MSGNYDENFDEIFRPTLSRDDVRTEVRSEVQRTLADIAQYSAQTTAGVQHAVQEVVSQLPDFKERMPRMQAVLKEEPVLADAISQAESNPNLQNYLAPLYKLTIGSVRVRLSPAPSHHKGSG